jgi:hypothetical protein
VRSVTYSCSNCGKVTARSELTVKRIQFATMGEGYKTLKSRTTAWLCEPCRLADPAWNQELIFDAPGMVGEVPRSAKRK